MGLFSRLAAADHVADVDNKEPVLPTTEHNADVPWREKEETGCDYSPARQAPWPAPLWPQSHTMLLPESRLDVIMEIQQASGSCWQSLDKEAVVRQIGSCSEGNPPRRSGSAVVKQCINYRLSELQGLDKPNWSLI